MTAAGAVVRAELYPQALRAELAQYTQAGYCGQHGLRPLAVRAALDTLAARRGDAEALPIVRRITGIGFTVVAMPSQHWWHPMEHEQMHSTLNQRAALGAIFAAALLTSPWSVSTISGSSSALAQTIPSSARPGIRPCSEERKLRSQHSREPTSITFVNRSGLYRSLNWIDFKGASKNYGGLNPGETKTISTFRTHPWVSATGPGDCVQIILPSAEPGTVYLK